MKDAFLVVSAGFLGLAAVTLSKGATWLYRKQAKLLTDAFSGPLAAELDRSERMH